MLAILTECGQVELRPWQKLRAFRVGGCGLGKLKAALPRLTATVPRIGYAQGDTRQQDRSREAFAPWRAWYRTAKWKKLRHRILHRDLFTCRMCGAVSQHGMVVDHVAQHRGDEALFWDEGNLQVLCHSPCHSKHKQRAERRRQG